MLKALSVIALAAVVAGCCKSKDNDPGPIPITTTQDPFGGKVSPATANPGNPTTIETVSPTVATPPPATTPASGGYAPDGLPVDIPASRSAVPTVAEWDSVPREISVSRSTPLNCETKMLREWLRVSCRPKSSTGGTPTGVKHKLGPEADTYYFSKGGIASLVTPVKRGKHQESIFTWTDKVQTLVIDWPHGAPRPVIRFTD